MVGKGRGVVVQPHPDSSSRTQTLCVDTLSSYQNADALRLLYAAAVAACCFVHGGLGFVFCGRDAYAPFRIVGCATERGGK